MEGGGDGVVKAAHLRAEIFCRHPYYFSLFSLPLGGFHLREPAPDPSEKIFRRHCIHWNNRTSQSAIHFQTDEIMKCWKYLAGFGSSVARILSTVDEFSPNSTKNIGDERWLILEIDKKFENFVLIQILWGKCSSTLLKVKVDGTSKI